MKLYYSEDTLEEILNRINPKSILEFLSKADFKNLRLLNCSLILFQCVTHHENSQGSWHGVKTPTNQQFFVVHFKYVKKMYF